MPAADSRASTNAGDPLSEPGRSVRFFQLGITAEQQGLTRTSKAKAGRDQAVGNFFDFAGKMAARERDLEEQE